MGKLSLKEAGLTEAAQLIKEKYWNLKQYLSSEFRYMAPILASVSQVDLGGKSERERERREMFTT